MKAFEAWNEQKTDTLKSKSSTKKKHQVNEKEAEEEKLQRKLEAKKYFESWKQNKDEELKVSTRPL